MDYNPRTATGIPTEPVGSIPRPSNCTGLRGLRRKENFEGAVGGGAKCSGRRYPQRFEATGSPIITDGEQRVSSFATYPIADTLAGSGLAPHLAPGGQYFCHLCRRAQSAATQGHRRTVPL